MWFCMPGIAWSCFRRFSQLQHVHAISRPVCLLARNFISFIILILMNIPIILFFMHTPSTRYREGFTCRTYMVERVHGRAFLPLFAIFFSCGDVEAKRYEGSAFAHRRRQSKNKTRRNEKNKSKTNDDDDNNTPFSL